jgi:hypothetical protein
MPRRFIVVVAKDDGGVELHPMKEWLRRHAEHIPPGLDPTSSTSHQLRNGLRTRGWQIEETAAEVRLVPPGGAPSHEVVTAVFGGEVEEDASGEAEFGLEAQLRDFIAQNLGAIDVAGQKLRLYVDPNGRDGVEYPTEVGPIDILAVDPSGNLVVFELKRARSPDSAIGQLARYMGWVNQNIAKNGTVSGVIVAKEITRNLRYAVSVVPRVQLFEYSVEFHLKPAGDIG